jgi:hypothetical protein
MAIQLSYTSLQGVVATTAYHQIVRVDYLVDNSPNCRATVRVYKDKTAKSTGYEPLDENIIKFDLTFGGKSPDPLAQAYTAIKKVETVTDSRGKSKPVNYKTGPRTDV